MFFLDQLHLGLLLHYWQRGFPWYLSNEYLLLRLLITWLLLLLLNRLTLISLLDLATTATLRLIIIATNLALILVLWMLAKCLYTKSKQKSFEKNEILVGNSRKITTVDIRTPKRAWFWILSGSGSVVWPVWLGFVLIISPLCSFCETGTIKSPIFVWAERVSWPFDSLFHSLRSNAVLLDPVSEYRVYKSVPQ